jgi:glycosyltransferase involved in cell wall biosynthesis
MLVNVTIPVFNEESRLAASLPQVHRRLGDQRRFEFELVIADNASTDRTVEIARGFVASHSNVRLVHLEEKGRGRALRKAWLESGADICSYMDVDLSTDLSAFGPLIEAVTTGGFDLAVGSRLLVGSAIRRGWKREFISRGYNRLIKVLCHTRFSDAQCGFKALTRRAAAALLPLVADENWFFDTELLVWAERLGYRICDLPVQWTDDSDSRVKILSTAIEDLKGLLRLRRALRRQGWRSSAQLPAPIGPAHRPH